jgi:hypothetical protein
VVLIRPGSAGIAGATFERSIQAPLLLPLSVKDVIAVREPSVRKRWEVVALSTAVERRLWWQRGGGGGGILYVWGQPII